MKKYNKKKKGYVLAIVIIVIFIMTMTVTSAFTILMRYMLAARGDLQNLSEQALNQYMIGEIYDASI